jgi:hypothetical protein
MKTALPELGADDSMTPGVLWLVCPALHPIPIPSMPTSLPPTPPSLNGIPEVGTLGTQRYSQTQDWREVVS